MRWRHRADKSKYVTCLTVTIAILGAFKRMLNRLRFTQNYWNFAVLRQRREIWYERSGYGVWRRWIRKNHAFQQSIRSDPPDGDDLYPVSLIAAPGRGPAVRAWHRHL